MREAGGSCRRGRPAGSACATHSPDRRSSSGGPDSGGPLRPRGRAAPTPPARLPASSSGPA